MLHASTALPGCLTRLYTRSQDTLSLAWNARNLAQPNECTAGIVMEGSSRKFDECFCILRLRAIRACCSLAEKCSIVLRKCSGNRLGSYSTSMSRPAHGQNSRQWSEPFACMCCTTSPTASASTQNDLAGLRRLADHFTFDKAATECLEASYSPITHLKCILARFSFCKEPWLRV